MENKDLYYYARRGILAEIDDWKAKRKAVEALKGVLSEQEKANMLKGIDQAVTELKQLKEALYE